MTRDEREDYGEEARDAIEGLRRLARRVETPPDLLPTILARGEELLPPQEARRARWWTMVAAWRPHPFAWGPVVAVTFFIAGLLIPWPRASVPLQEAVFEEPSAPPTGVLRKESPEAPPMSPSTPSQLPTQEMRQQSEPAPAPPEPLTALARRSPHQASSASQRPVTTILPAELYAQLQQEAQRRRISLAVILREAAEAYVQSHPSER
jgi:hypothetical protein